MTGTRVENGEFYLGTATAFLLVLCVTGSLKPNLSFLEHSGFYSPKRTVPGKWVS